MLESDFIDAINAAPDDRFPQRVYADWLDGMDDPRAEAWRVLVEQGKRPLFSTPELVSKYSWTGWNWWGSERDFDGIYSPLLPLSSFVPDDLRVVGRDENGVHWWRSPFPTFHAAMDAAAIAWVRCHRDADFMREPKPIVEISNGGDRGYWRSRFDAKDN